MSINQIIAILMAKKNIVISIFLVTLLSALLVAFLIPKKYTASTAILLNYKGVDAVTGLALPAQLMPGYVATQIDIIKSRRVASEVIEKLGIADRAEFKDNFKGDGDDSYSSYKSWLIEQVLASLDVIPSKESSVIVLSYKSPDPEFSALAVNTFANAYVDTSLQLKSDPAIRASRFFSTQVKSLHDRLEEAQTKLSAYKHEHGITSTEETLDIESSKLRDLSQQYSSAQSLAYEAQSRSRDAVKSIEDSPDVGMSPVINNLKVTLATAEAKLADLSEKYSPNHPDFKAISAEVEKLKAQLSVETHRVVKSVNSSSVINTQRMSQLKDQLEQQKSKVLAVNNARAQLNLLERDVQSAQNALDAVNNRFSQTTIEGQANQSDISILEAATVPYQPSSPRKILVLLMATIMGLILGGSVALILELLDRRVRTKEDILSTLNIPVFVIEAPKPAQLKRSANLLK